MGCYGVALVVFDEQCRCIHADNSEQTICKFELDPSERNYETELKLRGLTRTVRCYQKLCRVSHNAKQ